MTGLTLWKQKPRDVIFWQAVKTWEEEEEGDDNYGVVMILIMSFSCIRYITYCNPIFFSMYLSFFLPFQPISAVFSGNLILLLSLECTHVVGFYFIIQTEKVLTDFFPYHVYLTASFRLLINLSLKCLATFLKIQLLLNFSK